MKELRTCHPQICCFGILIILSKKYLEVSWYKKGTLTSSFLLESRRWNSCLRDPLPIPGGKKYSHHQRCGTQIERSLNKQILSKWLLSSFSLPIYFSYFSTTSAIFLTWHLGTTVPESSSACVLQLLSPHAVATEAHVPKACAPQWEEPLQREVPALHLERRPCLPQLEKSPCTATKTQCKQK